MESFEKLIESMNPEIYQNLLTAVEIGKWADGTKLTQEQKEHAMQATITYAAKNNLNTGELFSIDASGNLVDGVVLKKMNNKKNLSGTNQSIDIKQK